MEPGKGREGYPLLLYMENDGKKQHWDQEKYPCFFWQVSVDKDTEHMDIAEQMRALVEEFPIDVSRIYGTGAGRAADMLWEMMGAYPDLFVAVAVSGGAGQTWKVRRASDAPAWISAVRTTAIVRRADRLVLPGKAAPWLPHSRKEPPYGRK